jgi:hypothetical protein
MDKYLAFTDEAAAKAVLYRIEGAVEATEHTEAVEGYEVANYANIDTLGVLYERQDDPEAEPVAIPGWHVNVRVVEGENPTALQPFAITPTNPRRIWG